MATSRVVLILFAFTATINVMASGNGPASLDWATKPLLMPLLAGFLWLAAREAGGRADWLLLAGLLFATGGDIALMFNGTLAFIVGMALFLSCHVCYIAAFVRAGALARLRRPALLAVAIGYLLVLAVTIPWLWPGLGTLAIPVAAYALALAAMATTAAAYDWRVGVGGALFLVSDLLIAARVAGAGELPGPPIWVMATYAVGQALIVTGWAGRVSEANGASLQQVGA